jgi:hypothetical protein
MKRVWRVGRDGRIGFRRRETLLGDRRIVVAVDETDAMAASKAFMRSG